jgi:hypothetical protein
MGSCSQEAPPRGSCGFSPGGIPVASSSEACRSGARLNDEFYTAEDPRRGRKTDERGDILIGRPHPQAITAERPDEGDEAALVEWLTTIVRGAPSLMRVLLAIRALDLPDWLIMSGAVYQRVLNALTKRPPDYGVRDYDVGYFDASDISYEAEDGVIRRVAGALTSRCEALSKYATRRASMSGLRAISASRTRHYRARPKHWNASCRRCSRSACG